MARKKASKKKVTKKRVHNQRLNCKWESCNCLDNKKWVDAQRCRWIYIIGINPSIKDDPPRWDNLEKQNTGFANNEDVNGYCYVGETVCMPENRLKQHMTGYSQAKCWQHMTKLLGYEKLSQDPKLGGTLSDQAKEREQARAHELREEGYWVWSH